MNDSDPHLADEARSELGPPPDDPAQFERWKELRKLEVENEKLILDRQKVAIEQRKLNYASAWFARYGALVVVIVGALFTGAISYQVERVKKGVGSVQADVGSIQRDAETDRAIQARTVAREAGTPNVPQQKIDLSPSQCAWQPMQERFTVQLLPPIKPIGDDRQVDEIILPTDFYRDYPIPKQGFKIKDPAFVEPVRVDEEATRTTIRNGYYRSGNSLWSIEPPPREGDGYRIKRGLQAADAHAYASFGVIVSGTIAWQQKPASCP